MNLKTAFLPVYRADADDYWLGLGVIALIDALRITLAGPGAGLLTFLIIVFFFIALHINRLRDAGRPGALAMIAAAVALAAKGIVALIAMAVSLTPLLFEYFQSQGINTEDPQALQEASQDPALMQGFQTYLENQGPEFALQLAGAGAWPSLFGFWIAALLMGLWYARMGPRA
ncbi:hypothetical protein [Marinicauda sp. Alg238-R41]|uniref:hypothetical protein n=1 Tax=Marinicauda sp. Alg238-R41 TaxID=2993447 RepID=UPI0022E38F83|nr:hypothetical protein [Marinicauda sp. Alg238-R41]